MEQTENNILERCGITLSNNNETEDEENEPTPLNQVQFVVNQASQACSSDKGKKKQVMRWTDEKDVWLLKETLASNPFRGKKWSKERGRIWAEVAENLFTCVSINTNQRGVATRYLKLRDDYLKKKQGGRISIRYRSTRTI
jgi:hypothetical protein